MRRAGRVIMLSILGLLEVIFLSWAIAPNLPHRSADLREFAKYQSAPTDQNRELWIQERERTQSQMRFRRYIGGGLAAANLFLIVWLGRRRPARSFGSGS